METSLYVSGDEGLTPEVISEIPGNGDDACSVFVIPGVEMTKWSGGLTAH
ncbi:MAG: hypothetical protein WB562_02755 [Candidatus Sulfotelmatobacter sp.]